MSSHTYLASKKDLVRMFEQKPEQIQYYLKYSAFFGDKDAIEYIEKKVADYHASK